jgi:hypothetical protein
MKKIFKTFYLSLAFLCLLGISAKLEAGVIMISPVAFKLADTSFQDYYVANSSQLYVTQWDTGTPHDADFMAPLNLPQGVVIKKLTIYITDDGSGPSEFLNVMLKRANAMKGTAGVEVLAWTSTEALPSSPYIRKLSNTTLKYNAIDNKNYSYNLDVRFYYGCSNAVKLHAVKIEW